jgi:hypothetical protein
VLKVSVDAADIVLWEVFDTSDFSKSRRQNIRLLSHGGRAA